MTYAVNPFCDGISLKKEDCGVPCSHLRCSVGVCEIAEFNNDPVAYEVKKSKKIILNYITAGMWWEAFNINEALFEGGCLGFERYETFRLLHFSCSI